jgi:ABC-type nitrate/sulfonate/bicarbonate transport system substrate-binding protein
MVGGHIDGGTPSTVDALFANAAGANIKLIDTSYRIYTPEELPYICVLKDSPINTVKDLDGKIIAGHLSGSASWINTQIALNEHDVKYKEYIGGPAGQYQPMLIAESVDAAVFWPSERFVKFKGQFKDILPLNAAALQPIGYWFTDEFLQEHPEAVRKFMAAVEQAREYEKNNMMEVLELMSGYTVRTYEEWKELWELGILDGRAPEPVLEVWRLEYTHDAMLDLELLDGPLDIEQYIDTRFIETVREMPKGLFDWLPE